MSGRHLATKVHPPVRLELSVNPVNIAETCRLAREAERLGYSRFGVWDSPALYSEPWVTLSAVADVTEQIPIGPNVTNPLTRHPVITASAAASLAQVAPGRVYVAIGTGYSGVYNLGYRPASREQLRRYVLTLRSLLDRGEADYRGQRVFLTRPARDRIPIYVSAHGPKTIQLASEIADGVLIGLGISEDVIRACLETVAESATRVGRDLSEIDLWWSSVAVRIDKRPGQAIQDAGWMMALHAHHLARSMEGKLVPEALCNPIKKLGEAYDIDTHAAPSDEQRQAYAQLATELGVSEYLTDRFLIAGTPAEVRNRFSSLACAGANQLSLSVVTSGIQNVRACATILSLRRSA